MISSVLFSLFAYSKPSSIDWAILTRTDFECSLLMSSSWLCIRRDISAGVSTSMLSSTTTAALALIRASRTSEPRKFDSIETSGSFSITAGLNRLEIFASSRCFWYARTVGSSNKSILANERGIPELLKLSAFTLNSVTFGDGPRAEGSGTTDRIPARSRHVMESGSSDPSISAKQLCTRTSHCSRSGIAPACNFSIPSMSSISCILRDNSVVISSGVSRYEPLIRTRESDPNKTSWNAFVNFWVLLSISSLTVLINAFFKYPPKSLRNTRMALMGPIRSGLSLFSESKNSYLKRPASITWSAKSWISLGSSSTTLIDAVVANENPVSGVRIFLIPLSSMKPAEAALPNALTILVGLSALIAASCLSTRGKCSWQLNPPVQTRPVNASVLASSEPTGCNARNRSTILVSSCRRFVVYPKGSCELENVVPSAQIVRV